MKRIFLIWLSLLLLPAMAQSGRLVTHEYLLKTSSDTSISKSSPDRILGNQDVIGLHFGNQPQYGLLHFDTRSLSEASTHPITEATLRININYQGGGGLTDTTGRVMGLSFHRLLVPFDENSTWNSLNLVEGVHYDRTPITTAEISGQQTGEHLISGFQQLFQDWATGTKPNHGIIIIPFVPTGASFYSTLTFRAHDYAKAHDDFPQIKLRLQNSTAPYTIQGSDIKEQLISQTLYVSPSGNDTNEGTTPTNALLTINHALGLAAARQSNFQGTKILIADGTYREQLNALTAHTTPAACHNPIIIEAVNSGNVTITGANAWTNWNATSNPKIVTAPWNYDWGNVVDIPAGGTAYEQEWIRDHPLLRRREMISVDGVIYRQTLDLNSLEEGCFFADETNDLLHLHFQPSHNTSSSIEVSERPACLSTQGTHHLVLRGLNFTHAGSVLLNRGGVSLSDASELLIEHCSFDQNNGNGLSIYGTDADIDGFPMTYPCSGVTCRHLTWNNNGIGGIETYANKNLLIEHCESNRNNWRGNWEGFRFGWVASRLYRNHNVIINNLTANHNECRGWWFDYENRDISVTNSDFSYNLTNGLKFEVNHGPITLTNCTINQNGEAGITATNSGSTNLTDCTLHQNGQTQIQIYPLTGHFLRDWETFVSTTQHSEGWDVTGCSFETSLGQSFWSTPDLNYPFINSLNSNRNLYCSEHRLDGFETIPTQRQNLASWKSYSSQDLHSLDCALSSFSSPSQITLPVTIDTTLRANTPTDSSGGTSPYLTQTIYGADRHSLLKFDLSSLSSFDPNTQIIDSATLNILVNQIHHNGNPNVTGLSHKLSLHQLYQAWDENSTWDSLDQMTPGRTYNPTAFAEIEISGSAGTGLRNITGLSQALQKWLTGEWQNHGLVIISNATSAPFNYLSIRSRETSNSSERPQLEVTLKSRSPNETFTSWSTQYFSPREITDPARIINSLDSDSDQLTLLQEYAHGTDPTSYSPLTPLSLSSNYSLRITTKQGPFTQPAPGQYQIDDLLYTIQSSTNLTHWVPYTQTTLNTTLSPSPTNQTLQLQPLNTSKPQEFYKVKIELTP